VTWIVPALSQRRGPLLCSPPAPRGARRSRGLRAPEPRSLPLGGRSQAGRVARAPEPRRPVRPEPAWTLSAARLSLWGPHPALMRPQGTSLQAPRELPTLRLTCTPCHPAARGCPAFRPAGLWSPTSQSPPSHQPNTCRTSGPAPHSTAATSTRAPRKVTRGAAGSARPDLSPSLPWPPGPPCFSLPLAYFSTFCPSHLSPRLPRKPDRRWPGSGKGQCSAGGRATRVPRQR
jgi:hypothetical protein